MSQQVHFNESELILPAEVPRVLHDRCRITVPLRLQERRIYLYMEVKQSAAAQFLAWADVVAYKGGSPVGNFPAKLADFTGVTPGRSVSTLFNAGGSPVGDSLVLRLAQPFDPNVTSVVVQPLRVNGQFDQLAFSLNGLSGTNLTGFRAYLACLSTQY